MRPRIPLRFRLPNPPPAFVGRASEVALLAAAVRRSPVTVVWGLGGVGKTALALHTLRRRFASQVPRVLLLALRPGCARPDLEAARVLGQAVGGRIDWPDLASDPELVAAAVIDLAESERWWILVEDLQNADPAAVGTFLTLFGRYARRSRLVATSRVDPGIALSSGTTIPLGAMRDADLVRMARRARRLSIGEATRAARGAWGSPWRLLQRIAVRGVAIGSDSDASSESGSDSATATATDSASASASAADAAALGVSPDLRRFLVRLSVVQVPVPRASLEAIAKPPEPLDSLLRRGLIEASGGGVRVHDVVRGILPPARGGEFESARLRAGSALAASGDPAAVVEGVRLLLDAGRPEEAARGLHDRIERLLDQGFGPRLWERLAGEAHPALASARLRCAVDLGTADAIARIDRPAGEDLGDRLHWARALRFSGDLKGAAEVAARVQEGAGGGPLGFEAGLLHCRCRIVLGAAEEILERAGRLVPRSIDDEARRDALVAQALTYLGRTGEATAIARTLRASFPRLAPNARLEVGGGIARVFYDATLLAEADEVLDGILDALGPSAPFRSHGRMALHLKTYLAQDRGRLVEARRLLARLATESSFLRASARSVEATIRLAEGTLDGLDDFLNGSVADAEGMGNRNYRDMADGMRVRLATVLGRRRALTVDPPDDTPDPTIRAFRALWEIQNAVRHGATPSQPFPAPRDLASNVEVRVLARCVAAERAFLDGDADGARADARTAVDWAREAGLALAEADALLVLCDLLLAGNGDGLPAALRRLSAIAAQLPSARLAGEARFHAAALEADPAALEARVAEAVAPVAARRAAALLGEPVTLDLVDRRVVDAVRRRFGEDTVDRICSAGAGGTPWGIDERRPRVWMADGRVVSFAKRPLLFRLLLALARRGGTATKEELVREVWNEREYHRLRHDNRLHLAVLKLRRAIESDPAVPALLLATTEGYALGGTVRWRRPVRPLPGGGAA